MKDFQKDMNKSYIRLIKRFYKYYTKKDLDDSNDIIKAINNDDAYSLERINEDFMFLNDDRIFNDIIITFTNNINDLHIIFENINNDFIQKVNPYKERLNSNKKNIDNPDLSFNKEDIMKNLKNTKLTYAERILYGLYMMIEPIKYDVLRFIKINQIKDGKIYLNTNIQKRAQAQILDIPNEIIDIIDKSNEYLLGMEYTQSGISKLFKNAFQKIYGISYGIYDIKRLRKILKNI